MNINEFPEEIFYIIFKKILFDDVHSIFSMRSVCTRWRTTIDNDKFFKIAVPTCILREKFNKCTDFSVIQWLKRFFDIGEQHIEFLSHTLFLKSIKNEDFKIFDWFISYIDSSYYCIKAIEYIFNNIIKFNSIKLFYRCIDKFVSKGKWIMHHKQIGKYILRFALIKCNKKIVTYVIDTWHMQISSERITRIVKAIFMDGASLGLLHCMQWLRSEYPSIICNDNHYMGRSILYAFRNGQFEVCKWLEKEFNLQADDIPWENNYDFIGGVIKLGSFSMLKWINQLFFDDGSLVNLASNSIVSAAVFKGDINILKWAYEENRSACVREVSHLSEYQVGSCPFVVAAVHGYFDIILWIYETFTKPTNNMKTVAFASAAKNGHINILEWLAPLIPQDDNIVSASYNAFIASIQNGKLDVLKWFNKQSYISFYELKSFIYNVFETADIPRHIDVLQWLNTIYIFDDEIVKRLLFYMIVFEPKNVKTDIEVLEWLKQRNLLPKKLSEFNSICTGCRTVTDVAEFIIMNTKPGVAVWFIKTYSMKRLQIAFEDRHRLLLRCISFDNLKDLIFLEQIAIITADEVRHNFNYAIRSAVHEDNECAVHWLINTFSLTTADIVLTEHIPPLYPEDSHSTSHDRTILETEQISYRTGSALTIAIKKANIDVLQYFIARFSSCKREILNQKTALFREAIFHDYYHVLEWYKKTFSMTTTDYELMNEITTTMSPSSCKNVRFWLENNINDNCKHRNKRHKK